jgi:hypothetical protein
MQRPFTWADHVNVYWDEALNINHFDGLLYPHMEERLLGFCPDFHASPDSYQVIGEEQLVERYSHLQLRDTAGLRLGNLCPEPDPDGATAPVTGAAGRAH